MNVTRLVSMANGISHFFESEAGAGGAPASIALHMQRYWDPRMRAQIMAHAAAGGAGLSAAALDAVRTLPPAPQR